MKLLLVGSETAAGAEITGSLTSYKYRNDVILMPDADQATLAKVVAGAYALVYSTRFAGVAMPVYAAMQCEVPVIALEGAAAREAGGEGVLYADPESLEDLADKMCLLYKDEELRSRLLNNIRKTDRTGAFGTLIID
jgi:glycosyltransferase involved in cell wall biosynthesis